MKTTIKQAIETYASIMNITVNEAKQLIKTNNQAQENVFLLACGAITLK